MKTQKTGDDVLKMIRKIRKKHHKETKNMSIDEQMEYYHKKAQRFDERLAQYRKEKNNKN
jgi:hypothetical protein